MTTKKAQRKTGAILGFVNTILSAGISIIYIPLLLGSIGKNEYGLYQLLGSVIAYFSTMYTSLYSSVMKYYTKYLIEDDSIRMENTLAISRKIFLWTSLVVVIISVPIGYIYSFAYANSFTAWEMHESLIMFIIMIINIIVSLNNAVYSAAILSHERFIFRKSLDIISQCIQPIAVIFFIKRIPYAYIIVLIQLVLNILVSFCSYIYSKNNLHISIKYHEKYKEISNGILKLSGSILFVAFADQIFWKTDQLVLGQMYGTAIVAIYSIGSQLNTMYISGGTVMSGVILPMLVNIMKDDDVKKLSDTFIKMGRFQSYLLCLILSGTIVFGKEFIILISGKEYLEAYYVALLLMIPYTVDLIQNSGNTILQIQNKYWYRARVLFISALLNVVLTIIFAKKFGMIGAAGATTIAITISSWFIMNYIYSKKIHLDIYRYWKKITPIWIVGIIPALLGTVLINYIHIQNAFLQFALHIVLYIVIYCVIMFLFMDKNEKQFVLGKLYKDNN